MEFDGNRMKINAIQLLGCIVGLLSLGLCQLGHLKWHHFINTGRHLGLPTCPIGAHIRWIIEVRKVCTNWTSALGVIEH